MSQSHVMFRARAQEEIKTHKGLVAVVLRLVRFHSLGCSVNPTFFLFLSVSLPIFLHLLKKRNNLSCRRLNFLYVFFLPARQPKSEFRSYCSCIEIL